MQTQSHQKSVSLEIEHVYAPARSVRLCGLNNSGKFRWDASELAEKLCAARELEGHVATRFGIPTEDILRLALLDDVVACERKRQSSDPARWELFSAVSRASVAAATDAQIYLESSFASRGRELQALIRQVATSRGIQIKDDSKIFIPTSHGVVDVQISGFKGVTDRSHPSCAVLDLAWTEWRLRHQHRTFTALPNDYFKQQRQVAALAALVDLPRRELATALFLNRDGVIVRDLEFGSVKLVEIRG